IQPHKEALVQSFQSWLGDLVGKACPTYAENAALVEALVEEADLAGVFFMARDEREKGGDGELHPIRLYCEDDSRTGKFRARLGDEGSTPIYSGVLFPELRVVLGSPRALHNSQNLPGSP